MAVTGEQQTFNHPPSLPLRKWSHRRKNSSLAPLGSHAAVRLICLRNFYGVSFALLYIGLDTGMPALREQLIFARTLLLDGRGHMQKTRIALTKPQQKSRSVQCRLIRSTTERLSGVFIAATERKPANRDHIASVTSRHHTKDASTLKNVGK